MPYLSKEELLKAVGEEPIVEDENDKTQIALVLQYRKLLDIINSLPTYSDKQIADFYNNFTKVSEIVDYLFEDDKINIKVDRKYDYNPYKDTIGYRKFAERQEEKQKQFNKTFIDEWVSYDDKLNTGDITKMPKDWSESLL